MQSKGRLAATGKITLQPQLAWLVDANGKNFDPGAFAVEWPGSLGFKLATQGKMTDQGPDATLKLTELAGRLRDTFDLPEPAAPPGLTTREGQIATLAAAGLSNLEISRRLVISVRTVECHLARVYHKLGVTSRRALPEFVYAA